MRVNQLLALVLCFSWDGNKWCTAVHCCRLGRHSLQLQAQAEGRGSGTERGGGGEKAGVGGGVRARARWEGERESAHTLPPPHTAY